MAISEKLRFILEADVGDAIKGFEQVGKAADEKLGGVESKIDKLGVGMTRAGAAMLAAGGLAAVGLVKAAGAASDLAEATNITNITFGAAADEVSAFAQTAAESLGQSERAAREATASFGGLLQNLGYTQTEAADLSIDLTRLASDLGSAFNREPAEAVQALGSAIRGETEPIRAFNVMLSDEAVRLKAVEMGLAASTSQVDANGKAQATLALIMEQTSRYQGDFANTADGAANAQRRLTAQWEDFQAALGEQVLPIMEDVLGAANDLLGGVMSLNERTDGLVTTVATWGTGLLLAGGALSTVIGKAIELRSGLGQLTERFGTTKVVAFTGALAAATGVLIQMQQRAAEVEAVLSRWENAFGNADGDVNALRQQLNDMIVDMPALAAAMEAAGMTTADLAEAALGGEAAFADFAQALLDVVGDAELGRTGFRELVTELGKIPVAQANVERTARLAGVGMGELADASLVARDRMADYRDVTDEAAEATDETRTAFELLRDALDQSEALDNAKEQMEEAFAAIFTGATNAKDEVLQAVAAVALLAESTGRLDDHPIVMEIAVAVEQGDLDKALRKARELQAITNVVSGRSSPGSNFTPPPLPNFGTIDWSFLDGTRAAGGPVMGGGTYLVGERGPEILTMGAAGYVHPNAGGGGRAYSITVNALDPAQAGRVVVDAIREFERSNGTSWRSAG